VWLFVGACALDVLVLPAERDSAKCGLNGRVRALVSLNMKSD